MRAAEGESGCELQGKAVSPFPWDMVIHVGFCLLRLSSRDFWALTPLEFAAMTGSIRPRGDAPDRGGLEALMQAFPDKSEVGDG